MPDGQDRVTGKDRQSFGYDDSSWHINIALLDTKLIGYMNVKDSQLSEKLESIAVFRVLLMDFRINGRHKQNPHVSLNSHLN